MIGEAGVCESIREHDHPAEHVGRKVEAISGAECLNPAYSMHDSEGEPLGCEGWTSGRLVASFVHLHFGQDEQLATRLVAAARAAAADRRSLVGERGSAALV